MSYSTFVQAEWDSERPAPNPAEYPERPEQSLSYWIRNYAIPFEDECAKSPVPTDVDVAIIGSGITAAAAVYELSKRRPSLRVAVIEARGLCTGATGRNGGHLFRPEAFHFTETAASVGAEESVKLRKLALRNRDLLLQAIRENGAQDEVDLQVSGTLTVFASEEERDDFLGSVEGCRQNGHEPEGYCIGAEEVLKKVPLTPDMAKFGAAFIDESGIVYPRKLVAMLLRTSMARMPGLSIHPYNPVSAVEQFGDDGDEYRYRVVSSKKTLRARVVLHATNAYVSHLVPELCGKGGVVGRREHMLGVAPNRHESVKAPLMPGFGYDDFWHYIQQRPGNGPFLYGHADEVAEASFDDTTTIAADHPKRARMLRFLETAFPQSFAGLDETRDVQYDWTGIVGMTEDWASIVGRPAPERRGEFCSVGHNGEGMGRCYVCAEVVVEAMVAHLDGDEDWEPPTWFPEVFSRNLGKRT